MRKQNKKQSLQRQQIFTPIWVIDAMLDLIPWDDTTTWLEPSAGDGAFVKRLIERGIKPSQITAWEIDPTFEKSLIDTGVHVVIGDFFTMEQTKPYFNVVIGNPPYNKPDSISPIYNLFIEGIIDNIKPDYFSFIIPSRWITCGRGLDKFRNRMMNDRHMKKIVHFAGDKEVFNTASIKGGVNYFLWENEYDGECEFCHGNTSSKRFMNTHDVILQDNNAFGILDKVMNKTSNWISDKCLSSRPFGLRSDFSDWNETGVKCYSAKKKINFCNSDAFTDKSNVLSKWKVVTSKGINPNKEGRFEVYNNLFVIEPNTICTETYLVVNTFETENEANHFLLYMKSRFFRFMVSLRVLTQNMCMDSFNWVPDLKDYSTVWTDKELYEHFKLTRQEVAYIESKIKAI